MLLPTPRSTLTDTLCPYTTLFRSVHARRPVSMRLPERSFHRMHAGRHWRGRGLRRRSGSWRRPASPHGRLDRHRAWRIRYALATPASEQIGRAHVCTPVTNAHLLCSLLHAKTQHHPTYALKTTEHKNT